jgi:hypothetical protein
MPRRSRKHKKSFGCGHRGFGKVCNRCAETHALQELKAAKLLERQISRQQWQQSFLEDQVDLSGLPRRIVLKARQVLLALREGMSLQRLRGKRFSFDRDLIRIPVTYRYRLLCRQQQGRIVPLRVVSHETYNPIARNRGCV